MHHVAGTDVICIVVVFGRHVQRAIVKAVSLALAPQGVPYGIC